MGEALKDSLRRGAWPKTFPVLTPEQRAISDDFMRHWHEVLPRRYGLIERFNHGYAVAAAPPRPRSRTLEIGAGLGEHLAYEKLEGQEYTCVELRESMAREIERKYPRVRTLIGDCQQRLPLPSGHFDRILAIHVLEHLPDLPAAIVEMERLLAPTGVLCVVIPCDPGLAYSLARKISAELVFRRRYRQSYKWFIKREHINSPAEIIDQLKRYFDVATRRFFPLEVPLVDLNLCLGMVLRKRLGS
jgi:SAM-dependent methyltransferase